MLAYAYTYDFTERSTVHVEAEGRCVYSVCDICVLFCLSFLNKGKTRILPFILISTMPPGQSKLKGKTLYSQSQEIISNVYGFIKEEAKNKEGFLPVYYKEVLKVQ